MNPKLLALYAALKIVGTRADDAASDAAIDAAIAKANEMSAALDVALPAGTAAELRAKITALETELAGAKAQLEAATNTQAAMIEPDAIPEMIDTAMEADIPAPPAEGVTIPPAQQKLDARNAKIRARVDASAAERGRLEQLAKMVRIDAAEVGKLGNAQLRRAIVFAADPEARKDGTADYYKARADHLHTTQARGDSLAPDPYHTLTVPEGATRQDTAAERQARIDSDVDCGTAFLRSVQAAHNARFGIGHTPVQ